MLYKLASFSALLGAVSGASTTESSGSTCYDIKSAYQSSSCCNSNLQQTTDYIVSPPAPPTPGAHDDDTNPCYGTKLVHTNTEQDNNYFHNTNCTLESGVVAVAEQSGANVTAGYTGLRSAVAVDGPITTPYFENAMCPVNVHWHLGAEHLSAGQFDETGSGPGQDSHRRLMVRRKLGDSSEVRQGFQCKHYDAADAKFTTEYDWKHCVGMEVGQTYEVHWPHSNAGACGTVHQYQTPFYDGVFCRTAEAGISLDPLNTYKKIGVQAQIFTIVNDEDYYYPDLMRGMIMDSTHGLDIAKYTGSTTGTSRDNEVCSMYTPITWQVDRTCHMISASTFDKMCADMKTQRDDMSDDLHAHGARELVADHLAADNLQRMRNRA